LLLVLCGVTTNAAEFVRGQILIKPRAQLSESTLAERLEGHGAWQRQKLLHSDVRIVNISEERAGAVLAALQRDPDLEFAERDGLAQAAFVPNDPYVTTGNEWHLGKIQAEQAWDTSAGSASVVVAVLDSGVNFSHPDLAGRVLAGYDFVSNDTDPSDDFGHGTAVTGVVVATGNNGVGVAGVAWNCRALAVKVVDSTGFASYSAIAQGIRYAVERGARVINISIAGDSPSSTLQEAIDFAWSNNVVVVAAAGNNSSEVPQYPAACNHVVAVSATEPDDSLATFSNWGTFVALSAPGDDIWTTQRDLSQPYGSWRGTSFASPIVAGVLALAASVNPSLSNTQLVSVVEATADDIGAAGYDTSFGYGRVNASRAVTLAKSGTVPSPAQGPAVAVGFTDAPPDGARLNSAVISVAGTAAAATNLDHVELQVNDRPIQFANGTENWNALVTLDAGLNVIRVRAVDVAGHVSAEAKRAWFYVVMAPLSLQINGTGTVTPNLNGRLLEIGRAYSLRANAGASQVFAGWEGLNSESPVLTFVMQSNLTLTANFAASPFPALVGSYAGLVANTNDVTPEGSAYFQLTVTAAGAFSGKVVSDRGYGFHGQFNLAGNATVNVRRGALNPLHLTIHSDLTNGTGQITGSATDGIWTSDVSSDRNVFSARSNPAQQAGLWQFLLENGAASTTAGSCSNRIALNGAASLRGKLVDGRPFARVSSLAKNGDCPFYLSSNRGTEVVLGWLNFPANQSSSALGSVLWVQTGTNAFAATLQATAAK
jgi:subtilisin family serine protease